MKHKKIISILAILSISSSLALNATTVNAIHYKVTDDGTKVDSHGQVIILNHYSKFWKKWRKVVLGQDTTFTQYKRKYNIYDNPEPLNHIRLKKGTVFYVRNKGTDTDFWSVKGKNFPQTNGYSWSFDDHKVDQYNWDYPGFELATSSKVKEDKISGDIPTPVITTKSVKIWKEKLAKYHYLVRTVGKSRTLKKGTKMNILWGGMGFDWIMVKKGYPSSGLTQKYNLKSHGYIWVVSKDYTDTSWFKFQQNNQNNVIRKWTSRE